MDLTIEKSGDSSLVVLKGELAVEDAGQLKLALAAALRDGSVEIDLSGASSINVFCLQVLCSAHRSAAISGRKISISAGSGPFTEEVKRAGLFPNICRKHPAGGHCLWMGPGTCGEAGI